MKAANSTQGQPMSSETPSSTAGESFNTQDLQGLWNDDLAKASSHIGEPNTPTADCRTGLQAGTRPLPDYELVRKLGEGGFGEVWQARGPGDVDVAMKFIRLGDRGAELQTRALEAMKSIRHPNLVSLLGIWRTDNVLILAMELCDRNLEERLHEALEQKLPGIPLPELLKYMAAAADGLDELNKHNVQHRDVKPANLLLVGAGVKVADFGLAKALEQSMANNSTGVRSL
jgi:serine/threonine protein kinase